MLNRVFVTHEVNVVRYVDLHEHLAVAKAKDAVVPIRARLCGFQCLTAVSVDIVQN